MSDDWKKAVLDDLARQGVTEEDWEYCDDLFLVCEECGQDGVFYAFWDYVDNADVKQIWFHDSQDEPGFGPYCRECSEAICEAAEIERLEWEAIVQASRDAEQ